MDLSVNVDETETLNPEFFGNPDPNNSSQQQMTKKFTDEFHRIKNSNSPNRSLKLADLYGLFISRRNHDIRWDPVERWMKMNPDQ